MDKLEADLQPSGYLVGERFSVADLTAASLFTPLVAPPGASLRAVGADAPRSRSCATS